MKPTFFVEVVWGNKMRIAPSSIREIAYVWLDCICVPQADPVLQASAIGSIPNYVANSSFFVVLAGAWVHEDHDALRDIRAWCGCRMPRARARRRVESWSATPCPAQGERKGLERVWPHLRTAGPRRPCETPL